MQLKIDPKSSTVTFTTTLNTPPVESASGKSLVLASTHGGVVTSTTHDGKPVVVNFNAYVKK